MLFHHYTHFWMTHQAIRFQNFGDLLLRLEFGEARDAETNRHKWNANRARLADPQFASQLWHIEHGDIQKVAIPNDIFVWTGLRFRGEIANALVGLLRGFEDGSAPVQKPAERA